MFKELNILKPFFESPTKEFNVREAARILKLAPATVSKELKFLAGKGVLKKKEERNLILYKSNLDNELYLDLKVFYNIRKIKRSGFIDELNKIYLKPAIVLFGSCSEGLDVEDSDIDLLIISEKITEFKNTRKFEKKLNRKIQLFIVTNIKELKNEYLINNALNGIKLQGEIRWI